MDYGKVIELIQNKSLEAEILGEILANETLFSEIESYSKDIFYSTKHQEIFDVMKELRSKNSVIDLVTVCKIAKEKYKNIPISYISELSSSISTTVNFDTHIKLLLDYANKRDILKTINELDYSSDSEDIANSLYNLLDKILVTERADKTTKEYMFDYIDNMYKPKNEKGIMLGLNTLDKKIGGLQPGQLITIAGYTGMGKSILVSQLVLNMLKANKKIDLFSLEMSRKEIIDKLVSNSCSIDFNNIRQLKLEAKEKEEAMSFISTWLAPRSFEIYEFMDDINKIINQIKKDKLKNDIDIVFIDLINRVTDSGNKNKNRADFLGSLTRGLKVLAGKLKITIVITAQINRSVESRSSKEPTLADIKESGGIAEDSDYVIGIYRNKDLEDPQVREKLNSEGKLKYNVKDAEINPNCVEVHMLKSRNFQGFKAGFYWDGKYQRIGNFV